jgi:predicted dehydrogenase
MEKRTRVGIVGCGRVAQADRIPSLLRIRDDEHIT